MPFGTSRLSDIDITFQRIGAAIRSTITDHAGTDITSNFQIMFYQRQQDRNVSDEAGRDLKGRDGPLMRDIDTCADSSSTFINSNCDHVDGKSGSMQAYTIVCEAFNIFSGGAMHYSKSGHCEDSEICVPGTAPPGVGIPSGRAAMASCVAKSGFNKMKDPRSLWNSVAGSFQSTYLSMSMSKRDASTSMEVASFNVEAGSQNQSPNSNTAGQSIDKGSNYCQDCTDLETEAYEKDTDLLQVQTRLLTTGILIQGILWIAVLSL